MTVITAVSVFLLALPYLVYNHYGTSNIENGVRIAIIVTAGLGTLGWLLTILLPIARRELRRLIDRYYIYCIVIGGLIFMLIEDAMVFDMPTYIFYSYGSVLFFYLIAFIKEMILAFRDTGKKHKLLLRSIHLILMPLTSSMALIGDNSWLSAGVLLLLLTSYIYQMFVDSEKSSYKEQAIIALALPFLMIVLSVPIEKVKEFEGGVHYEEQPEKALISLYKTYEESFTIGVALDAEFAESSEKSWLVNHHFGSLTAENAMKPESIMDSQNRGSYRWTDADRLTEFSTEHGKVMRGHTLIWHSQTPDWFFREDFEDEGALVSREVMLERMENHIKEVLTHYDGSTITAWDVVNEAIEVFDEDGYRNSYWLQIIGEDYIEKAFEYARKYTDGEDVKLFYNDFGLYSNSKKRNMVYELVSELNAKGLIDGIGLQTHVSMQYPTSAEVAATIELFGDLGLEVHITELDVNYYNTNSGSVAKADENRLIEQAYRYRDLFDVFEDNSDVISNVTFWGVADHQSWLNWYPNQRNNWPLIFDRNLRAKPAFYALIKTSELPVKADYSFMGSIEKSLKQLLNVD